MTDPSAAKSSKLLRPCVDVGAKIDDYRIRRISYDRASKGSAIYAFHGAEYDSRGGDRRPCGTHTHERRCLARLDRPGSHENRCVGFRSECRHRGLILGDHATGTNDLQRQV